MLRLQDIDKSLYYLHKAHIDQPKLKAIFVYLLFLINGLKMSIGLSASMYLSPKIRLISAKVYTKIATSSVGSLYARAFEPESLSHQFASP